MAVAERSGESGASAPDRRSADGPPLRKIDFNLLVPLQALLVEANITRAAERTSVGQPAMSAALARLRRHFNDQLLVRDGRRMTLTPLATSLIDPVNKVLDAMRAVMDNYTAFDPASVRRTFTVITSDYVAAVLIRPLLRVIAVEAPHVRVSVVAARDGMVSSLRRVECDLLIAPSALMSRQVLGYQGAELFTERFLLVVDKRNTAVGDRVTLDELARLPHLAPPLPVRRELGSAEHGLPEPAFVHPGDFAAAMHLVVGTRMTTLVQASLFTLYGEAVGLRAVALDAGLPRLTPTMYWHPECTADPAHSWFRGRLAEVAKSLNG